MSRARPWVPGGPVIRNRADHGLMVRRAGEEEPLVTDGAVDRIVLPSPGLWDFVDVTCWCERSIVRVPMREVRAGLTRSCGTKRCEAARP